MDTTAPFLQTLRELQLVFPAQEKQFVDLGKQFVDPRELARRLVALGWLTPYQVNRLVQGRGRELVVGPYRLLESIGRGGMGQVFKARHTLMQRVVALKVIRPAWLPEPEARQRFLREIQAAAKLAHPNVVMAHDAAQVDDSFYLAMELVEGTDLDKMLQKQGRLPVAQACDYAHQAALGLQHAHEHGMVHRDVKPSNLMVSGAGVVKVLDFGLAQVRTEREANLTRDGQLMGTPNYMAPEQAIQAAAVDIRADVYSLGCTLYHLLTGQPPFKEKSLSEKLLAHQTHAPPPVGQLVAVPTELEEIVRGMMAKRPEDRPQTPALVADALAIFAGKGKSQTATLPWRRPSDFPPGGSDSRTKGRRWLWIGGVAAGGAVGVASMLVFLFWFFIRPPDAPRKPGPGPGAAAPQSPDPAPLDEPIAWNEDVRAFVQKIRKGGVDNYVGRQIYSEVTTAIDTDKEGTWVIGGGLTSDGKVYAIKVENGGMFTSVVPPGEAQQAVKEVSIARTIDASFRMRVRQLVTLKELKLRVLDDAQRNRYVMGHVTCQRAENAEVKDLALVLRSPLTKGSREGTNDKFQHLELTEVPSGPLEVDMDLPPNTELLEQGGQLYLQAFLYRPKPGWYRISNELAYTSLAPK